MRKLLFLILGVVAPASAQFIGYTSPQSVNIRNIIDSASGPTVVQVSQNIGQTFHFLTWRYNQGDTCRLIIRIEASQDGINWFTISKDGTESPNATATGVEAGIFATGSYPALRISLNTFSCGLGTTRISATYSGTSSTELSAQGAFGGAGSGGVQKFVIASGINFPNGSSRSAVFRTPYGSTRGQVSIRFSAPLAGSCAITVFGFTLQGQLLASATFNSPITPSATNGRFLVDIDHTEAEIVQFFLATCGADQGFLDAVYFFYPPGYSKDCTSPRIVNVSGVGNTLLLDAAGATFIRFRVCQINLSFASAVDVKLTQGTGATCGTGTADLTGTYRSATAVNLNFQQGITANPQQNVCINLSAIVNGGGIITFANN